MEVLPLHQVAHLLVEPLRGTAGPTPSMLSTSGRQNFISRVFHLEFVAHGGRVGLSDQVLGGMNEIRRSHYHRPFTVYHILNVLLRDAMIFLALARAGP